MGVEEFGVLLEEAHAAAASALALSVREAITEIGFSGSLSDLTVTASVGFHYREASEPVEKCIQRADHAVYCAKLDGRDRVVGARIENGFAIMKQVA